MTDTQKFFLDWVVSLATAIGTVAAVIIALFGDKIGARFFPPLLTLELLSEIGEESPIKNTLGVVVEHARYYHLRVTNSRRWSNAEEVQVFLLRIETPNANGSLGVAWHGDVPFRWRHQEYVPILRTVGPTLDCDICKIGSLSGLSLMTLIQPFNVPIHYAGRCRLVISAQARSHHGDSQVLRIEIDWDGTWHHGNAMRAHALVRPSPY